MPTVTLVSTLKLDGRETVDTTKSPSADTVRAEYRFTAWNTLDVKDVLDVDVVDISHTLSGTTGSKDLTAAPLARDNTQTLNLSTRKLWAVQLYAPSTNTGAITIKQGATNGFPLLGGSSQVILAPGDRCVLVGTSVTTRQAVDATHKTVDFAGTSGDKVYIVAYFKV